MVFYGWHPLLFVWGCPGCISPSSYGLCGCSVGVCNFNGFNIQVQMIILLVIYSVGFGNTAILTQSYESVAQCISDKNDIIAAIKKENIKKIKCHDRDNIIYD